MLLTGDLGFTVVEPFAERFPERFFNVGVARAEHGRGSDRPRRGRDTSRSSYSIATFATLRSYEFVRNGPVLHRLPVRFVGVGGGSSTG